MAQFSKRRKTPLTQDGAARRLDIGTKCRSKYDLQKNQDPSIWACAVSAVCWWAQAKFGLSQWYYKEQLSN